MTTHRDDGKDAPVGHERHKAPGTLPPLLRHTHEPPATAGVTFGVPERLAWTERSDRWQAYRERMAKDEPRKRYFSDLPIRFRNVLLLAVGLASVSLFQSYLNHALYAEAMNLRPFEWIQRIPVPFLNFLTWALLCPAIYKVLKRWGWRSGPKWRVVGIHAIMAVAFSTLHEAISAPIYYSILALFGQFLIDDQLHRAWVFDSFAPSVVFRFLEYWVVLGILIALENGRLRRAQEEVVMNLRNELQTSQLNALRGQLQPHFLFNALNTVSSLMEERVEEARAMLEQLGRLLRTALNKDHRDRVTLAQEIDHISDYLGIQSMRFRDRLKVQYQVEAECGDAVVPSMILQPLVENSIKHSASRANQALSIKVEAFRDCDRLVLRVLDNGNGCANLEKAIHGDGIGLRNVRERLQLQYRGQAEMTITSNIGQGFVVSIDLPFTTALQPHAKH